MHIVYLMWGKMSGRSQTMSAGGNIYTGPEKLFYACRVCIQGKIELALQKIHCSPEIFHWN